MKTCLYNGYINPQAYSVFPQLYEIQPKTDNFVERARFNGILRVISINDDFEDLIFQNTNQIDLTSLAGKEIQIQLLNKLGSVVLGGWLLPASTEEETNENIEILNDIEYGE